MRSCVKPSAQRLIKRGGKLTKRTDIFKHLSEREKERQGDPPRQPQPEIPRCPHSAGHGAGRAPACASPAHQLKRWGSCASAVEAPSSPSLARSLAPLPGWVLLYAPGAPALSGAGKLRRGRCRGSPVGSSTASGPDTPGAGGAAAAIIFRGRLRSAPGRAAAAGSRGERAALRARPAGERGGGRGRGERCCPPRSRWRLPTAEPAGAPHVPRLTALRGGRGGRGAAHPGGTKPRPCRLCLPAALRELQPVMGGAFSGRSVTRVKQA